MSAPLLHAFTLDTDLPASMDKALKSFAARFNGTPVAAWLHPSRIPESWPTAWPPSVADDKLNRNLVGLEVGAGADEPQQLRLI